MAGTNTTPSRFGAARRTLLAGASAIGLAMAASAPANAWSFTIGELEGTFNSTFTVGVSVRTQETDCKLLNAGNAATLFGGCVSPYGSANNDNGNLNFEKWDVVSGSGKGLHELSMTWRNFGVFVRGTYFYDIGAKNHGYDFQDITAIGEERTFKNGRFLDYFVRGNFNVGDLPLEVRVGAQVVNWGESTFYQNYSAAINGIDITALRRPGSEIKEALLPTQQVWMSLGLPANFALEAYYQWDWEPFEIDAPGSFFSTSDVAGRGATNVVSLFGVDAFNPLTPCFFPQAVAPNQQTQCGDQIRKSPDIEARNSGQWGVALRYYSDEILGGTEFGFYYSNYHSRLPTFSYILGVDPTPAGAPVAVPLPLQPVFGPFFPGNWLAALTSVNPLATPNNVFDFNRYVSLSQEYVEDLDIFGFSVATTLFGVGVQAELTYKQDVPLLLDDLEMLKAVLSATGTHQLVFGPDIPGAVGTGATRQAIFPETPYNFITGATPTRFKNYIQEDVWQGQIGFTYLFKGSDPITQFIGATGITMVGEIAAVYADIPDTGTLALEAAGQNGNVFAGAENFADDLSAGYTILLAAEYNSVFGVFNVTPQVSFSHDFYGTTFIGTPTSFLEDRTSLALGLTANYLSWRGNVSYTNFMGAGTRNLNRDRDFLSFSVSYAF